MDNMLNQLLLLLEPLGLLWLALLVGAVAAWRKRLRPVAAFAATLALLIYLLGATSLPGWLLRGLERPFAGRDYRSLAAADAVVVLGGSSEPASVEAGGFHLSRAGDRLLMGLELIRLRKAPALVLGGGLAKIQGKLVAENDVVKRWIDEAELGRGAEVLSLGGCRNTHDEATRMQALAVARGWQRILLVTSAAHLRRSVATFRTVGVPGVEPVPCNFLTSVNTGSSEGGPTLVPHWGGLEKISIWLHETVGWYEYRRRGWIDPSR